MWVPFGHVLRAAETQLPNNPDFVGSRAATRFSLLLSARSDSSCQRLPSHFNGPIAALPSLLINNRTLYLMSRSDLLSFGACAIDRRSGAGRQRADRIPGTLTRRATRHLSRRAGEVGLRPPFPVTMNLVPGLRAGCVNYHSVGSVLAESCGGDCPGRERKPGCARVAGSRWRGVARGRRIEFVANATAT